MLKPWDEVLQLATKHGFVAYSYSGYAVLVSHEEQIRLWGEEEHQRIQEMNKGKPEQVK